MSKKIVTINGTQLLYTWIGTKMGALREAKGIEQQAMADQLGMSKANYSNLERGVQQIYIHQLYAIAEILEVKPEKLMKGVI